MSAEVATVSAFWKPLAWVFGGLLALIKVFIGYIWLTHKKDVDSLATKNTALEKKVNDLELDITKNYYDKDEISRHIVEPIREDMRETNATLKLLTSHYGEMQQDLAIIKYTIQSDEIRKQREPRD